MSIFDFLAVDIWYLGVVMRRLNGARFLEKYDQFEEVEVSSSNIDLHRVFLLNVQSAHMLLPYFSKRYVCVWMQDIRRFFQPTSPKPAVQRSAPNGDNKTEKKKKSTSSEEDMKKKKKESGKASLSSFVPLLLKTHLFPRLIHVFLLCAAGQKLQARQETQG